MIKKMNVPKTEKLLIISVICAVGITIGSRLILKAYRIPTDTMENTIAVGDCILVNKAAFLFKNPKRGDVVVFEYPEDPSKDFIKRVIGTPGETVQVINKKVYVNGKLYENPHEVHKEPDIIPKEQNPRDNTDPITVPANSYFVMGDNRDRSYDSRFWKFVRNDQIKGLAFIKYWSWDKEHSRVRWRSIGKLID